MALTLLVAIPTVLGNAPNARRGPMTPSDMAAGPGRPSSMSHPDVAAAGVGRTESPDRTGAGNPAWEFSGASTAAGPCRLWAPPPGPASCPSVLGGRLGTNGGNGPAIRPEVGTVLGTPSKGIAFPGPPTFDGVNGYTYVPDESGKTVTVIQGIRVIATVTVGSAPTAIAVNDSSGWAYVANTGSGNVSVINGTQVVGALKTGSQPYSLVVDPRNGDLYIANFGSNTVSIFNSTGLVSTLSVGNQPSWVLFDPENGLVYVSGNAAVGNGHITVINGTRIAATLVVGSGPTAPCLNPVSDLVYQPNSLGSGGITVINGTHDVTNISDSGGPNACTFDPATDRVYVTDNSANTVRVIAGTTLQTSVSVGASPEQAIYDPANTDMYVTDFGSGTSNGSLSVLHGTRVIGNITVGWGPTFGAGAGGLGDLYISNQVGNTVSFVSTVLGVGPIAFVPPGNPLQSLDLGASMAVTGAIWGIGAGRLNVSWNVSPPLGLGCPSSLNYTPPNPLNEPAAFNFTCTPIQVGAFVLSFNVTDQSNATLLDSVPFTVFADPHGDAPVVTAAPGVTNASSVTNRSVTFAARPAGGTGAYSGYVWHGISAPQCSGLATARARCVFPVPATLSISYSFTDSNGRSSTSSILPYTIIRPLTVGAVSASLPSTDVGAAVRFNATVTGGSGTLLNLAWTGLPTVCPSAPGLSLTCRFDASGTYSIALVANDSFGETAQSPNRTFVVYPALAAAAPDVNPRAIDVGQPLAISTSVTGGDGNPVLAWSGLPANCTGASTATAISCVPSSAGVVTIQVEVTDASGGDAIPPATALVIFKDPTVTAPTTNGTPIVAGAPVSVHVVASGGDGSYSFAWAGSGCQGHAASATCQFGEPGHHAVYVLVTDGNGFSVRSATTVLVVAAPSTNGASNASGGPVVYLGVAAAAIAVAGAAGWVVLRRHRGPRKRP